MENPEIVVSVLCNFSENVLFRSFRRNHFYVLMKDCLTHQYHYLEVAESLPSFLFSKNPLQPHWNRFNRTNLRSLVLPPGF